VADDGDKPLGTVQLPRGAILDAAAIASPASEMPTVADRQPAAEPIGKTVVPASDIAADLGTPPELPPPWRYELTVEIARGGMGRVVEANDLVLGRTVALKEALSRDPDSIKRFERETRITARLEHPSIVPVHDAGTTPVGAPFYVMRKIGGRPLEELVGKLPELTDRLALLPHMVASANAVAHAHERGIVHRDVKPSNILVGDLGETMLIDWGLAKALGEPDPDEAPRILAPVYEDDSDIVKTRAGVVFGTPGFMAPEQLRGAPPDERCDVYALGATMYHLLARRPPHYSKNAADMMRAAVDGPAEPLRHRVPGVPPELATIVDKALAFERDDRYRSARALADDLQRFIGGQLVASHHYSQREKLARWVRNNRTTVTVAATALVAMVAGGSFAVSRIVAARDREHLAAEKAREQTKLAEAESTKATASLEALQLADARNLTLDDPTRAIAMVKPLVPTRWREARDVAAAARANGVAYSLPASPHAVSLELSRDGQRALEAGDDGIVRIYDLAKRTQTVIADAKTPTPAHFGDAEHTVVLFRDNHITLVDVATKSRRDVMTPTAIARLEVAGPIAYWIDPQHALWKLDLAGGQASKVATDEPIDGVFPSPDGRWIALGGSQHVFLIDRTAATTPPQPITGASNIHALQWSADALHAVMLTDDELVDLKVDEVPHVDHRYNVGRLRSVAWSRRGTYATGALGVELLHRDNDDHGVRVQAADCTLGLYATWNDAIVAGRPTKLSIVSDDGDRVIDSPLRLEKLAASPHGPFIAAATEGALLVWDLEAVLPRHVGDAAPTGAGFVTSDAVIASYDGAPAQWIDLRNNMPTPLGELQPIVSVTGSPDGQRAFVIDVTHRGRIVAPVGDPVELDADIDRAEFVDEHHLVLATSQGAVLVAEPSQPRGARSLVKRDAQVVALAASAADGGWIAAAFADHALWRAQLDGKAEALQQLRLPPGKAGLALGRDGEVVVASGPELRVWRADGTLDTLWTAPHSIHELAYIDALHVLAIASDGKATIVDTREPNHVQAINVEIASPTLAGDASLAAMVTSSGTLELADPLASEHWQLAPRGRGMTGVQLSPDGKRVIAIAGDHLLAWTPALPDGVDATTRWLDALTNAAIDRGPTAALGWKMLKPPTP
jgi:WD40 repeat protein